MKWQQSRTISTTPRVDGRNSSLAWVRLLAPALLIVALGTSTTALAADSGVKIEFTTGGDDLRGGDDNLNVRLIGEDGRELAARPNANSGQSWEGGSVHALTISMDQAQINRLARIELETTRGGFTVGGHVEGDDNWDLNRLRITSYSRADGPGGPETLLFETSGTPSIRFTGQRRTQQFSFAVHQCQTDADCDNGFSDDGEETCAVVRRALDRMPDRHCEEGIAPECPAGWEWSENTDGCVEIISFDIDGDGQRSIVHGGPDCDDQDANRLSGGVEVCDVDGVDEDCDLGTAGGRDLDGDGHLSSECFNWGPPPGD